MGGLGIGVEGGAVLVDRFEDGFGFGEGFFAGAGGGGGGGGGRGIRGADWG